MMSRVVYFFAAFSVMLTQYMMNLPVKGQSTLHGCDNADSLFNIVAEIQHMFVGAIRQEQTLQVRCTHETLNYSSFHQAVMTRLQVFDQDMKNLNLSLLQMKDQQATLMRSLQVVDRRFEEQVQGSKDLNTSFQELKIQLDTVLASLQVVGRRSQEQDIYIKQIPSTLELLNASVQELKTQQDNVMTSLEAVDRRSQEQDIYIKQIPNTHELLNASVQELKIQQNTVLTSLQLIGRSSQEQDIYIKQIPSIHERLNASVQQENSLNESLKQLKNQQDAVMTSLQAIDQRWQNQDICVGEFPNIQECLNASFQQIRNHHASILRRLDEVAELLLDHDISTKNQSQDSSKLATGSTLRPNTITDLVNDSTLLPSSNNWTIIMNRFNGSVNFTRTWIEYKNGFGEIGRGEFWLGNEEVHRLTTESGFVYALRVEVQLSATGVWYHADYTTFSLDSENNKYALRLSGFSGGDAGDSLINSSLPSSEYHGGMNFTTWDADNDKWSGGNCASQYEGGWWFISGYYACLTCQYSSDFHWSSLNHFSTGDVLLRAARMMIKSR